MSSPSQHIADRFVWLTRRRAAAGAFGIALLVVFVWPHARLAADLVIVTAIAGTIGAIVSGLTFWSKARVQIERRQLRYKAVRRVAAIVALACLPFVLMQRASIYLRSPREVVSQGSEAYPDIKQWRMHVVVAIAHLEGDDGNRLEARLRDALAGLDPRLHVIPVILNRTIAVSGRPQGIAHLEALESVTDVGVDALIWGGANGVAHPAVGPLYQTSFGNDPQFGGAYLPSDFKLPELPVDDLCTVLRLIVAIQSAEFMQQWKSFKFGDALEPLIKQVRAMADDPRKTSGWSADTRARVNLVVGIAANTSGSELESENSFRTAIVYFQRTQADWTRERDPLQWAMAQQNLGMAQRSLGKETLQNESLQAAATSYQNALAVYQSRSDRLDAANVQYTLGLTFERVGRLGAGVESLRKAADYYRAAASGFDPSYYPISFGAAHVGLGNTLRVLGYLDGSAKELEDSIAANREALKVYHRSSEPIYWASAEGQVAQSLETLGEMTSNRDDLKQSIALSRQILDGYPRERDPMVWAGVQINLGRALMGLYDLHHDSGRQCLVPAAKAFRASLEELSLEHQPEAWVSAKNGLGTALGELGRSTSDTYYLEQAADAFKDTLKFYKPDRQPMDWAMTKYDLGGVLLDLGELGPGVRYLKEAVDNYREALTVLSKDKSPELWRKVQESLKVALEDLRQRGSKGS